MNAYINWTRELYIIVISQKRKCYNKWCTYSDYIEYMGGFQLQKSSEIHLRAFFLPHFCFVLVAFANAHTNCDVWKCVCRAWFSSGHELEVYLSVPKLACTFPPTPYIWILPLPFEKTLIQLNSQCRHHFLPSLWQTPSGGFAWSAIPMRHFKWSKQVGARSTYYFGLYKESQGVEWKS